MALKLVSLHDVEKNALLLVSGLLKLFGSIYKCSTSLLYLALESDFYKSIFFHFLSNLNFIKNAQLNKNKNQAVIFPSVSEVFCQLHTGSRFGN